MENFAIRSESFKEYRCSLLLKIPYRIMLSVNVTFSLVLPVHYVWNKSQKDKVN